MRESRTPGSVRGGRGNPVPYRDPSGKVLTGRPPQRTSTFRNCQGSEVSRSSGNSPGRSVSGVQSV